PTKVVRYVVTDQAGSNTDVLARIVAEGLSEIFHHQVIVDNRAGAGGNIGAEIAARGSADGYTMLQIATTHTVNVSLYKKLGYDLVRDFSAVTQIAAGPSVVVVPSASPVKSVNDLVAVAKAKPGTINYSSAGLGTCTFLAAEKFKRQAGVDLVHVAYKGGAEAVTAVISGETSVYFAPLAPVLPQIRQGRLRALAVTTAEPLSLLPGYPTVAESGVRGYEAMCWYGLVVPAGTPKAIIAKIHDAVVAVLNKPNVKKRLGDLGFLPVGDQPEQFGAYIKSQIASNREIVRDIPAQ
ncbi:MAG TPA: tripartite tricarboxylate transporter substrate binding protein, partial [Burkholderiales bacterium]|nr:tripartite tricarboxylate transporter substrate binding protein [Burkholderiales bacterium]